jgi:hypothetical protein
MKPMWAQFRWYPWPSALHNIKVKNLKFHPMIPGEYPVGIMRKTFRWGNSIFQNALISCFPCDTQWVPLGITWKKIKIKIKNQFWHCVKPLARGITEIGVDIHFLRCPMGSCTSLSISPNTLQILLDHLMDQLMMLDSMGHWGKCSSVLVCQRVPKNSV